MDGDAKHHLVTKTADLVGFIRKIFSEIPGKWDTRFILFPQFMDQLKSALRAAGPGWCLQMVQVDHSGPRPGDPEVVFVTQYAQAFARLDEINLVRIDTVPKKILRGMRERAVRFVGNLVTCNEHGSENNLCHPVRLVEQIEAIEHALACSKIDNDLQAALFLEALEVAALRAWRRGDAFACVEIKDDITHGSRMLGFGSFSLARSAEVELGARRRGGAVVSIPAAQQDNPAVGASS